MNKIKLTESDLQKLTTKRLLRYRISLLKCPETPSWDDRRISKSDVNWKKHYALVKSILATREHVIRNTKGNMQNNEKLLVKRIN